ncbi:PSP1-domain-containing protein [Aureobasidium pullulans]|uniref:PSP1-domain-containing protein n=1 Tax=Aureobasidium pullulans TaxID=5580 RepID=A0AB74JGZ1_AURPU|nr:PSP1-domain-containing protein [Aureobasidium pullulans]
MAASTVNRSGFGPTVIRGEKIKFGRSTPDSEALASSEDEPELSHSASSVTVRPSAAAGIRRSSFLSEIKSGDLRKASVSGATMPSNGSQPSTPSAEHNPWTFGSALGRVPSNGSNGGAWATPNSIWGADRREMPLRINEGSSPAFAPQPSPGIVDQPESFPFNNMPLQPIMKTHRSQSYSVGQLETELGLQSPGAVGTPSRARPSATGPQYRPMRPSALGETVYTEGRPLGQLSEVEDDEGPDQGVLLAGPRTRQEQVSDLSNSLLRQATHESARAKHGSATLGASAAEDVRRNIRNPASPDNFAQSGADSAIDDDDFEQLYSGRPSNGLTQSMLQDASHRGMWSTSLGFGMDEINQSRRHSLADIPTRRGSLVGGLSGSGQGYSSVASAFANMPHGSENGSNGSALSEYHQTSHELENNMTESDMQHREYAQNYFSGLTTAHRNHAESSGLMMNNSHQSPYSSAGGAGNVFGRQGWSAPLYIVTFKCSRSGIFYIHEGTGLDVKEGDLVIVEADRGQDLGTVTHAKIDWPRAKETLEKTGEDHYKWLMMFSRHNLALTDSETRGLMASNGADRGSMHRDRPLDEYPPGMGGPPEMPTEPTKPKMIKRLAQPHEIANLREKEGNEAKAKRIAQQKANEHNLKMEILDAEFQLDWKKLTFYFYSTEYINFNLLVGDLFKIYKTRIWLSAINPAAFRSRPNQPPSSIGPGAIQPGASPRTMNPTASSFFVPRDGGGPNYASEATGRTPQSYYEPPVSQSQMQGQLGSRGGISRQQYYGSSGFAGTTEQNWYMPSSSYGQQAFDAPYGNAPSPSHELAFRPAPGLGQSLLRNGSRQARPGDFSHMR